MKKTIKLFLRLRMVLINLNIKNFDRRGSYPLVAASFYSHSSVQSVVTKTVSVIFCRVSCTGTYSFHSMIKPKLPQPVSLF